MSIEPRLIAKALFNRTDVSWYLSNESSQSTCSSASCRCWSNSISKEILCLERSPKKLGAYQETLKPPCSSRILPLADFRLKDRGSSDSVSAESHGTQRREIHVPAGTGDLSITLHPASFPIKKRPQGKTTTGETASCLSLLYSLKATRFSISYNCNHLTHIHQSVNAIPKLQPCQS